MIQCKEDILYFIEKYVYINDPQTYETFKYEPWDFQKDLLGTFDDHDRIIVLKGRQLGVSWLVAMYGLHRVLFFNNSNVLMLSKREDEAQKLLAKAKFIYDHLPEWMQESRPAVGRNGGNKKELEIVKRAGGKIRHRGKILALPATEDAGRSETASIVIADEWAFHKYADTNWSALSPTIDSGGKFIGVSTANGLGNFYYQVWLKASRHENDFKSVFLSYDLRPGRDQEWYEKTRKQYVDERIFQQEYPRSPMEAFISTGGCIFDLEGLQFIAESLCTTPMDLTQISSANRDLAGFVSKWRNTSVWMAPRAGEQYVIGADPAGGDDGGDFSTAYVLNKYTGEVYASIHGRIDPDNFAAMLAGLAEIYNNALLVVERNNHGYAVHLALRNVYNYGNIYVYKKDRQTGDGDGKEGMPTTSRTKPILETLLQTRIRDRALLVYDIEFVNEAQTFVRKPSGSTGAEGDAHDDRVMAMMMALQGVTAAKLQVARPGTYINRTPTFGRHFKTRHR